MKNKFILSGLIISTGFWLSATTWASSSTNERTLPPEFSVLSDSDRETLSTLTGTARDTFLESKGITRPESGSGMEHGLNHIDLTDAEKTALESMTETERQAFFVSKGITPPTNTWSSNPLSNQNDRRSLWWRNRWDSTQAGLIQTGTTQTGATISRAQRLKNNQAKLTSARIEKIQNKVVSGEKLTRLEKVFARKNNIDVGE